MPHLRAGQRHVRLRGLIGVGRRSQLIARDGAVGRKLAAALVIDAGPLEVSAGDLELSLRRGNVGASRGGAGEERLTGGGRLTVLALGTGKLCLGAVQCHLRIGGIEPDEHVARFHVRRILDQHRCGRARDPRRHLRHVGADIGVVGRDGPPGEQPLPCEHQQGDYGDRYAEDQEQALAQRGLARRRRGVGGN